MIRSLLHLPISALTETPSARFDPYVACARRQAGW